MRPIGVWMVIAGLVRASPGVFSVHDDLLAFPQYEVIFSDNYILDTDAQLRVSRDPRSSLPKDTHPSEDATNKPPSDLSPNGPPSDFPPSDSSPEPSSYHYMTLHDRPYLCAIPTVSSPTNTTNSTVDPDAEAAELARATDRGWELLKGMEGQCMYFISGWWSYSFCYNTAVTQFHALPPGKGGAPIFPPTEDPATPSYVLGKYDPISQHQRTPRKPPQQQLDAGTTDPSPPHSPPKDKDKAPGLRTAGSTRYLTQTLTSGTTCDLTHRPRRIEVQYHCHAQSADRIGWIKEVSTCTYQMGIYTARLCNDIAFLPPRETKAHGIICSEILPSSTPSSIASFEARKREDRARRLVSAAAAQGEGGGGRPTVAGIEVGAMKHVGKDGQRLEAPAQIGAPAMKGGGGRVDVLARQEAREKGGKVYVLPAKAIAELGVDPKLVEEAVKKLKDVAGGKAWRLEVFDGPMGGRELRGVVEPVEGEEKGGGGEVEFYVVDEDQGEDGVPRDEGEDEEEGSEEVFKDEL